MNSMDMNTDMKMGGTGTCKVSVGFKFGGSVIQLLADAGSLDALELEHHRRL